MHYSRMHTTRSPSRLLGGCLSQCMLGYTPWAWTPPTRVWAWKTPLPSGLGLDTPPAKPLNLTPGPGPRHPPLWTEFLTHTSENITLR